mmetsp:Transcript_19227/g.66275  ORF Transcript_19227/g.66275 Transcript_19227/m.66275 type:complete len:294 (-) Transcript_19227:141-1022(-)
MGCASSNASKVAGLPPGRFPTPLAASALGVLRLDYDYPPSPGDVDSPLSWDYRVYYRCVPGFTFAMCRSNELSSEVLVQLEAAVKWLVAKGCRGITGDCDFMMQLQPLIRTWTKLPVFMSSLMQLSTVRAGFAPGEQIAIFSANGGDLNRMFETFKAECREDARDDAFVIVGCEDVDSFEAVELGTKLDVEKVQPGIVAKALEVVAANPSLRAIVMECTVLPAFSDAVRSAMGLPVYDAITCCNMFMAGMQNNPRFGLEEWRHKFDGEQEVYRFGQHLSPAQQALLVNKPAAT